MASNVIEFILRLKNQMKPAVKAAQRNMQKSMAKNARAVKRFERTGVRSMTRFGRVVQKSKNRLRQISNSRFGRRIRRGFDRGRDAARRFGRQLSRVRNKVKSIGTRMKRWRSDLMGSLPFGRFLRNPLTIMAGAIAGVGKVAQSGMADQSVAQGFRPYVGNQSLAFYNQLQQQAAKTSFSIESFTQGTKSLLATGRTVKQVQGDMMGLANAVAAVGGRNQDLSQLADLMLRMKILGHGNQTIFKQFGTIGINVYKLLQKSTGKSIAQLKKMDVSYKMVTKAIKMAGKQGGMFYNGIAKQNATLVGQIQRMKTKIEIILGSLGQPMLPYITPIFRVLGRLIDKATSVFNRYSDIIAPAILAMGVLSTAILGAVAAQALFNLVTYANPYVALISVLLLVAAAYTYIIMKTKSWKRVFDLVVKSAKNMWYAFVTSLKIQWHNFTDGFLDSLDRMLIGYHKLTRALHIGDKNQHTNRIKQLKEEIKGRKQNMVILRMQKRQYSRTATYAGIMAGQAIGPSHFPSISGIKSAYNQKIKNEYNALKQQLGGGQLPGGGGAGGLSTGITAGGPQTVTININKEMIGSLELKSINVKEGLGQIENYLEEVLMRVLAGAAQS